MDDHIRYAADHAATNDSSKPRADYSSQPDQNHFRCNIHGGLTSQAVVTVASTHRERDLPFMVGGMTKSGSWHVTGVGR